MSDAKRTLWCVDVYTLVMATRAAQIDASALRRDLFNILKRISTGAPLQIMRNGKIVATLGPPPAEVRTEKPKIDRRRLAHLCKKHHIRRLALFGSILREDFGPDSDMDLLVDAEPGSLKTFEAFARAKSAFADLFGRPVDLVQRSLIEKSTNEIRRRSILDSARVIYGA